MGAGETGLSARVTVLTARMAKGLEFDAAVVVDQQTIAATDGAGSLYVALTRPTQRLYTVDPA